MKTDPISPYLAARRVAFTYIQDIRERNDAWLQSFVLYDRDLTALMPSKVSTLNAARPSRTCRWPSGR